LAGLFCYAAFFPVCLFRIFPGGIKKQTPLFLPVQLAKKQRNSKSGLDFRSFYMV
jgi:hypothetical protein